MALPLRRPASRSAPTPRPNAGSVRMNSGTPATRQQQDQAVRNAARNATPRQRQPIPPVQPLPVAPTDPTTAPYRAPRPVFSDAQYNQALETDFQFARRAADIATQNAISRDRAGVSARANAQRSLASQQNAAADRAQQRAIAAADRAQSRQVGLNRELQGNQIAASERMQSRALSGAASAQASAQNFTANQSTRAFNDQLALNAQTANLTRGAAAQASQSRINEIAAARQQTSFSAGTSGVGPDRKDIMTVATGAGLRTITTAWGAKQREIELEEQNLKLGALRGDAGAIARLQQLQGGGSSGGGGSVSTSTRTANYANPEDNPALALARENNTALAARQAAQLAASRDQQSSQIAAQDRDRAERLQYQREAPQIAANAEEELRRKARAAALAVFNSARPGMTLNAG